MKKMNLILVFCTLTFALCALCTISCKKEHVIGKPKISISVDPPGIVPFADSVTVSWETYDADICMLDEKPVELQGSRKIRIFLDTTLTFKVENENLSDSSVVRIDAGDWNSSYCGILTYPNPWLLKSMYYFVDGKVVDSIKIEEFSRNKRHYFHINGEEEVFDDKGEFLYKMEWYFIDKNHIFREGAEWRVDSLTEKVFISSLPQGDYKGTPKRFQYYYYRD
jgi:hypothetical protein